MWSRATIGLAYASALITDATATTTPLAVLDDDDHHRRHPGRPVAPVRHRRACTTRPAAGPTCASVTAVCPPADATYVLDDVSAARSRRCPRRPPPASASSRPPSTLAERIATANPYVAADVALTKGWCLRELGDEDAATGGVPRRRGRRPADRRRPPGAGQPALPADRHRRRDHRHPHRQVGPGHRDQPRRSAPRPTWPTSSTRCSTAPRPGSTS